MMMDATEAKGMVANGSTRGAATESSTLRREVGEDHICVLTFDRPNSAANVFDRTALEELDRELDVIAADSTIKGLILASAKKSIFVAGADLQSLARGTGEELRQMILLGQAVFNRIAALPIPTVAAIHGACLGGGYEVALACDYRIASPEKATRIGLPETNLGILPAWGGSTRLPRLIGLPAALDVILGGKALAARKALRVGMVDEVVPEEYLVPMARKRILEAGRGLKKRSRSLKLSLTTNGLAARIIARHLKPGLRRKTGGHYPAIEKALEVVARGVSLPMEGALALEVEAITELVRTQACRSLLSVFFLQERAKKITGIGSGQEVKKAPPVERVAVVGAGVMGAGIAQWASSRHLSVILKDINAEQVNKGMTTIAALYGQGVQRHSFTEVEAREGLDRIVPATVDVPLSRVDVVIEAAVERMDLKKRIFASLEQQAGPETILATNTSALSITELASELKRPGRVIGIHFFNPVHRMQLVEVVVGAATSPDVVHRSVRFVQQLGKLPVVVKDSPGFLVNRVLMPYLLEAGHLFEGGAGAEEIDRAMLDFGMPMGPLRLIDEVGVDVSEHVAQTLVSHFSPRMTMPPVLRRMLDAGFLGRKSGRGFYIHEGKGRSRLNPEVKAGSSGLARLSRAELQNRMVLLMVNEAARCVEEGVVESAEDADFGMIMGTGFAPFLGGPLRFADFVGAGDLVREMSALAEAGEQRFAPCERLRWMASNGKTFYDRKGN